MELASIRLLMRDPDARQFPVPIDFDNGRAAEIRYSRGEREALDRARDRIKNLGLTDVDFIARAIILHSDIAVSGNGSGNVLRYADGGRMEVDFGTADHWRMARSLAQLVERKAGRDADLALWYRASIAWMAAVQTWNAAHVEAALSRFGDDPGLQLLAGCMHEALASARTQAAIAASRLPNNVILRIDSASGELKGAAARLRRGLELNPQHAEARIHYGRVLTLTGRRVDAIETLRRALPLTKDPLLQYYAQIFLGAAFEAASDATAARSAYRAALELFPQAQVPRLALSELAASSGDRTEARTVLEPMLSAADGVPADPWSTYLPSCGRDYAALLAEAGRRLTATAKP
jgi:tetratricopeptide (TPR) repeat protein